ncbi:hypothetical protein PanWU01x14_018460 [Parasponia andersonii]|uniref:Uncharacterized protein n=1 Tax=Parasponia andersonii TaxID=3476 RepID=A0A2P5DZ61_PARAD|nr:hypothetical protein PanWU01x14_018460 [Parasponia andersonii]
MFHEFEDHRMEDMKEDDNPISPMQFKEKIGFESEFDIIEKGTQATVGLGNYKEILYTSLDQGSLKYGSNVT